MSVTDANTAISRIQQQCEAVQEQLTTRGQLVCMLEAGVGSLYERLVGVRWNLFLTILSNDVSPINRILLNFVLSHFGTRSEMT
jgi:hypothetical protein